MDDSLEVSGLSILLDDDVEPPYLDLTLRCGSRHYRAAVLAASGEWALNIRDADGRHCPGDGELYPAQADAVLAALLTALELGRSLEEP